jgi:hypothetical protein
VLVVLDGVRWQELFTGTDRRLAAQSRVEPADAERLMPHLHEAIARRGGAVGAPGFGPPIVATGPNFVSLPGYSEIMSGRRAHGCANNDCRPIAAPTVADEVRARAVDPADVAVFSSWNRIENAASRAPASIVLSTGRTRVSHEERIEEDEPSRLWREMGARAAPFPGDGDFRPDRFTAALALQYLQAKRPQFMFLGLGEPDEYAHRGDYAGYLSSLRAADDAIGGLFAVLDGMGARGAHTTVFVTTDHGRARDYRFHGADFPESGRVWLVAAGNGVRARGLVYARRRHHLADLAPTLRVLLDLAPDDGPSSGAPIDELLTPPPQLYAALQ